MLTSLQLLLTSIVDYAGLFPPAQLSLLEAMTIYDRAQTSPHAGMLDRFVIPVSRLGELDHALTELAGDRQGFSPWSLSVILSQNWAAELAQIHPISEWIGEKSERRLTIAAWEIAPLAPTEILQVCQHLPSGVPTFFELPFQVELEPYFNALHQTKAAAKLRTGGVTTVAFPDSHQLSHHILALAEAGIPFKATAGLHHPLRSQQCLTDQSDSPVATMHGFLNVAILAAFAHQQNISLDEAVALLETSELTQFHFTHTDLSWRDRSLSVSEIIHSRQQFFRSFGSCAFQDPLTDLQAMGLL